LHRDLNCGKLACSGGNTQFLRLYNYFAGNLECMVLSEKNTAPDVMDYGLVPDGVNCGVGKVSLNLSNPFLMFKISILL